MAMNHIKDSIISDLANKITIFSTYPIKLLNQNLGLKISGWMIEFNFALLSIMICYIFFQSVRILKKRRNKNVSI